MKFCQDHWDSLRAAISKRGLDQFVSKDGKELVSKIDLADGSMAFDPLMAAHMAIVGNAVEIGGLYLLTGDYCPICESIKNGGPSADWWINNAADEQYQKAVDRKLVTKEGA